MNTTYIIGGLIATTAVILLGLIVILIINVKMRAQIKGFEQGIELQAKDRAHDLIKEETTRIRDQERDYAKERIDSVLKDQDKTIRNELSKQELLHNAQFEAQRREFLNQQELLEVDFEIEKKELVQETRKETANRSRAVLKGKIGEQMAPLLQEFAEKYDLADARFLGNPIDYIVFKNLTKLKDEIKKKVPPDERSAIEVVILDIKTGGAQLNTEQRKIRDAINGGRVSWDEVRVLGE